MAEAKKLFFHIQETEIPVDLYSEWRSSVRMSIGKNSMIIRVPVLLGRQATTKQLVLAETWARKQFRKHPHLITRFRKKSYNKGDSLTIFGDHYILDIEDKDRKTCKAYLEGNTIHIVLSNFISKTDRAKSISTVLSRLLARAYQTKVEDRIYELNDRYFKKPIKKIRLKNNVTNWGSCSSTGNINISTRLLLAPSDVRDYVYIHELTHLVFMNHSKSFWATVQKIDPGFKDKELWLKNNGHLCQI